VSREVISFASYHKRAHYVQLTCILQAREALLVRGGKSRRLNPSFFQGLKLCRVVVDRDGDSLRPLHLREGVLRVGLQYPRFALLLPRSITERGAEVVDVISYLGLDIGDDCAVYGVVVTTLLGDFAHELGVRFLLGPHVDDGIPLFHRHCVFAQGTRKLIKQQYNQATTIQRTAVRTRLFVDRGAHRPLVGL